MFGEHFGLDYYQQRHAELVKRSEQAQLVRCLEAGRRAERRQMTKVGLPRRVLAATGGQLIRLGSRLQQVGIA